MRNRWLTLAAAIAGLLVVVSMTSAQNRTTDSAAKPTPRMADGHPDFTGFYLGGVAGLSSYNDEDGGDDVNLTKLPDGSTIFLYGGPLPQLPNRDQIRDEVPANAPPYKPEYMARVKTLVAGIYGSGNSSSRYDPMNDCKPHGVPRAGVGGAIQIFHNPKGLIIAYENSPGPVYRVIYTDGRQHPNDLDTSYMGNSIGHWEGDVLVVDTVGLNDETWLGQAKYSAIHSDKLHVVERFSRKGDELSREATVEDPVMFTRPWVLPAERTHIGNAGDYVQPQMCRTNDRDHLILQTEDNVYKCTWCQLDADAVYGKGAAADNAAAAAGRPRGDGGGGE